MIGGAWVLGPNLPGAEAEPLFDTHNDRGGVTEIVSPLVDIRSRLIDQSDVVAFRVEASSPAYWRLSALDDFDGQIWSRALFDVFRARVDLALSKLAPMAAG